MWVGAGSRARPADMYRGKQALPRRDHPRVSRIIVMIRYCPGHKETRNWELTVQLNHHCWKLSPGFNSFDTFYKLSADFEVGCVWTRARFRELQRAHVLNTLPGDCLFFVSPNLCSDRSHWPLDAGAQAVAYQMINKCSLDFLLQ